MSIASSWKVIGNCEQWGGVGGGGLQQQYFGGTYEAQLGFPEGWGRVLTKNPACEGSD